MSYKRSIILSICPRLHTQMMGKIAQSGTQPSAPTTTFMGTWALEFSVITPVRITSIDNVHGSVTDEDNHASAKFNIEHPYYVPQMLSYARYSIFDLLVMDFSY